MKQKIPKERMYVLEDLAACEPPESQPKNKTTGRIEPRPSAGEPFSIARARLAKCREDRDDRSWHFLVSENLGLPGEDPWVCQGVAIMQVLSCGQPAPA
jgi:hypothetical protein